MRNEMDFCLFRSEKPTFSNNFSRKQISLLNSKQSQSIETQYDFIYDIKRVIES